MESEYEVSIKSEPPDHLMEDFIMDENVNETNSLNSVEVPVVKQEYVTIEIENISNDIVENKIKTEDIDDDFLYENHEVKQDFVIGQTLLVNIPIEIDSNFPRCSGTKNYDKWRPRFSALSSELFTCHICKSQYTTEQLLKAHMDTHDTKKEKIRVKRIKRSEFKCSNCEAILPTTGSLNRHKKHHISEAEDKPIVCEICNTPFKSISEADAHDKAMHTKILKRSHKCMECGDIFDNYKNWYNHKLKHKDKKFICDLCKKGFKTIIMLKSHIDFHAREKPYLTQHKRLTHENGVKLITYRPHPSKQPTNLVHEKSLTSNNDEKLAEQVEKKKSKTHSLQTITKNTMDHLLPIRIGAYHLMSLTKNDVKEYICDVCGKHFPLKGSLDRHRLTHAKRRRFACKICEKTFTQKPHLVSHQLVHTKEKPFQCEFCLKRFTRSTYLNTHKRSHTGQHLFKCENCNKEFTRKSSYTQHMKMHIGPDEMKLAFHCDVCDKSFVTRSAFRHHRDLNHRPARYICDFCDKPFRYKSDHDRHNKVHKNEFECANCHLYFPSEIIMTEHQCVPDVTFEEDQDIVLGI